MEVVDAGHKFTLCSYDGFVPVDIQFMKREGEGYPFNTSHYPGTNCQEVLRVLISRIQYLQLQIPCFYNRVSILLLRVVLYLFEQRAAQRHSRVISIALWGIENVPTCNVCGHIDPSNHENCLPLNYENSKTIS